MKWAVHHICFYVQLTVEAIVEGKHKKISCEDSNVIPHKVLLKPKSWRNEGLADKLVKKQQIKYKQNQSN